MNRTLPIFLFLAGICLMGLPAAYAQNDWMQLDPATDPTPLAAHSMASLGDDKVLVFGGWEFSNDELYDETWIYDLSDNDWTLMDPSTSPSPRSFAVMSYAGDDHVLLFGGYPNGYPGTFGEDTWIYDLSENTWTLMEPSTIPVLGTSYGMAYLGGDQVLLVVGSVGGTGTWVYDVSDNTWTNKSPASPPVAPSHASILASIGGDQAVWYYRIGAPASKTWIYDLSDNTWTLKNPVPAPQIYVGPFSSFFVSLGGDRALLIGTTQTWIYDSGNNAWTQIFPSSSPDEDYGHDKEGIGTNHVLSFGTIDGISGYPVVETWLFTAWDEVCGSAPLCVSAGLDEHLYFGYGPDQCVTKTVVIDGGTAPYTYSWSLDRPLLLNVINASGDETMTGATTDAVTVCLLDTAILCVTVTDANGNTATDCVTIYAEDVRCFSGNNEKIIVCHNGNTICIDESALDGHLDHGDFVGSCTGNFEVPNVGNHGVAANNAKPELNIYPNPNTGDFVLSNGRIEMGIIQIVNSSGQIVQRITLKDQHEVDIHLQQPGFYFVQLITDSELITKRLTVVR